MSLVIKGFNQMVNTNYKVSCYRKTT